jgi:hypothetical protein
MKIAIVGGGFYGVYLAYKLSQNNKLQIDLFEKNNTILNETAIRNQYRLHTGYHYPRSLETIYQTILGYKKFKKEFKKFLYFPKNNFYLVHINSLISFNNYKKLFKNLNLNFKEINKKQISTYIKTNCIEGVLNTGEGVILLEKLFYFFNKEILKKIKIHKSTNISKIDEKSGKVYSETLIFTGYDYIINTTYTNPNLGLDQDKFAIKYELTGMVGIKNPFKKPLGLTIMDGNYCSLYPKNKFYSTISSVKFTPIIKSNSYKEILKEKKLINEKTVIKNIINDARKYIRLPQKFFELNLVTSTKVKLVADKNDTRISVIKQNNRLISILCGKLDAVTIIYNDIKKILFCTNNYDDD